MHVLLVHDDDNMRAALTRMLSGIDYDVLATGHAGALAAARRVTPELLVVDVDLARLERTLSLLAGLKRDLAQHGVVIAMLPAKVPIEVMRRISSAASLVRWLRRPFLQHELVKAVRDAEVFAKLSRRLSRPERSQEDALSDPLRAVIG